MVQTTPFKTRGEAQTAATWGIKPGAPPSTKIRKFTAYRNPAGTLLGFLSIELPSGLIINDAKLMIGQAGKH